MPRKKKAEGKKWYKSRTCWVGILEITGGIAVAIAGQLTTGGVLSVVGMLEIILRIITKTKLTT